MQASIELQVLVLIAAIAAAVVTALKFYEDRRIRDVALWLRQRYPDTWDSLPWLLKTADRAGAVEAFRSNPEIEDAELEHRCRMARRGRRRQAVALGVAVAAIVLAVAGHEFLGWHLSAG